MAASRRKQDDKNLEILRELISLNGNKYCLDCNQRGPTYVNTTIGSFVCSKCSGMLRGLTPPHRVKSISMATFTQEEIEYIKVRGNDFCRRVWLGLYEGESVNFTDEQSVKDFMSDKYEKKRYYLEASPNITSVTSGNLSVKNKTKGKLSNNNIVGVSSPLISISSQVPKTINNNNNNVNVAKVVSNLTPVSEPVHKLPRPVNNFTQPSPNKTLIAPAASSQSVPVPDFPVDFSNANIHNSTQYNSSINNNILTQAAFDSTPVFNAFNSPSASSNDRYAALADLDLALRQQNMKNMEDGHNVSRNPFQSTSASDIFSNKNPFFNGGWSTASPAMPVNPFMPANNGAFINSKNPFL